MELSTFLAIAGLHQAFLGKDVSCVLVELLSTEYAYKPTRVSKMCNTVPNVTIEKIQIIAFAVLATDSIIHSQTCAKRTDVSVTMVFWENA